MMTAPSPLYADLQRTAKELGIRANQKKHALVRAIASRLPPRPTTTVIGTSSTPSLKAVSSTPSLKAVSPTPSLKTATSTPANIDLEESCEINATGKNHVRKNTFDKETNEMGSLTPTVNDSKGAASTAKKSTTLTKNDRDTNLTELRKKLHMPSKIPKPSTTTTSSLRSSTKTPNFHKIHQRQFDKMESIGTYLDKKQQRRNQLRPQAAFVPKVLTTRNLNTNFSKQPPAVFKFSAPCFEEKVIPVVKKDRKEIYKKNPSSKSEKSAPQTKNKKSDQIIRGVRSNRRFLLQMKARGLAVEN